MKHCKACNVDISTPAILCPLCAGPLTDDGAPLQNVYPPMVERMNYNFVKRLLMLLSIIGVAVCAFVNLYVTKGLWWWLLALIGVVYAWVVTTHAMRRGGNRGGIVLMQVVSAGIVLVLADFLTGWRAWSINYLLPGVFCAGIVAIDIIILGNRTNWAGYVLYQVTLAAFGFLPTILYFTGVTYNLWFALAPAALAAVSLLALFLFGDRTIKNEFRRRFRF